MDGMVVVPECARLLEVGKVVILILARVDEILGPAVPWGTRGRAVKMDSTLSGGLVHETHHGLDAAWHDEGRSRSNAIVADKRGGATSGIHNLAEGFDLDLIVSDLLSRVGVGCGSVLMLESALAMMRVADTYKRGCLRGGMGSGF
jgi:hypothetical protein